MTTAATSTLVIKVTMALFKNNLLANFMFLEPTAFDTKAPRAMDKPIPIDVVKNEIVLA